MSDRSFGVILGARVDAYIAAMGKAQDSTKEFASKSKQDLDKLGGDMQSVGKKMTVGLTLPIIAAGGAAIKASVDFDSAFGKMVGLAGVSASEVDGLKTSVQALAVETGRSPQELADGLYFLRSSGLGAKESLDALKESARASAAGLGSTAVIADAVSSAMNAYATSGLDAARATDILVGTARAGKAEPAELAGALGRVLPIASELGITFEDVGGAIAALSLSGNDASTSATLLSNIMSKMLKPSQQGAEALGAVGMSADSIRQSIADKGLLATLQDLKARLGDAGFVKFLEDAQAVQGALALTGQNAEQVATTFATVKDSVGATDEAFAAMSETSGFKMKQAWAEVQTALIAAGDIIVPIVSDVAGAVADLAGKFTDLPSGVQTAIVAFLGLVAAAGPVVSIAGKVISNLGNIAKAASALFNVLTANPYVALAAGLAVVAIAIATHESASEKAAKRAREFYKEVQASVGQLDLQKVALLDAAGAAREYSDATFAGADKKLRDSIAGNQEYVKVLGELGLTLDEVVRVNRGGAEAQEVLNKVHERASSVAFEHTVTLGFLTQKLEQQAGASYDSAAAAAALVRVGDDQAYMYLKTSGNLGVLTDAERAEAEAHLDQTAAVKAGNEAAGSAATAVNELGLELAPIPGQVQATTAAIIPLVSEEDRMKEAAKHAADNVDELKKALQNAVSPFESLSSAASAFTKAMDDVMGGQRGVTETQQALIAGQAEMTKTVNEHKAALDADKTALDDSATSMNVNTETGRGNRDMVKSRTDEILNATAALVRDGMSNEEAAAQVDTMTASLGSQLTALGFSKDEVDAYVRSLGLTPENVRTAIELINNDKVKKELEDRLAQLDGIDDGAKAEILADIDNGSFDAASRALDKLDDARTVKLFIQTVTGDRGGFTPTATGGFFPGGTNQMRTVAETVGRSGDEAVLTLGNQARLQALLKDPRIGAPVAAAMPQQKAQIVEVTRDRGGVSVSFGDIYNTVDMDAALQRVQFAMAAAL